jgi:hypothetical protein
MTTQHASWHIRQRSGRRTIKLDSFLEIEQAIDRVKAVAERVTMRRQKDMQYERAKGKFYGFKAKAFNGVNVVWECSESGGEQDG